MDGWLIRLQHVTPCHAPSFTKISSDERIRVHSNRLRKLDEKLDFSNNKFGEAEYLEITLLWN